MAFLTEEIKKMIMDYEHDRPDVPAGWTYFEDNNNRYVLGEPVEPKQKNLLVIGINPSTAKPGQDDPTIRKVRNISKEQGYNGWIMVNIHPQRATNPKDMKPLSEDIAKNNLEVIRFICQAFDVKDALFAWGNLIDIFGKSSFLHTSQNQIEDLLKEMRVQCYHYSNLTKKGNPRHLLYAPYKKKLHIMEKFLFGYKMKPAWGHYEKTEGYSFMIQSDGKAVYNRFVMSGRQLSSETIQIEQNIVTELQQYLLERKSIIKNLPGSTNNGSLDGAYDTFTFLGESMTSLNPTIIPITESPKNEYEKQMLSVYQAENNAIEIFLGGIEILKKSNIKFSAKSWEKFGRGWHRNKNNVAK